MAAVSRKTNTTTHEILGVLTKGNTQIVCHIIRFIYSSAGSRLGNETTFSTFDLTIYILSLIFFKHSYGVLCLPLTGFGHLLPQKIYELAVFYFCFGRY